MSIIHDAIIQSYSVDFKAETLIINTIHHTDKILEETKISFEGYLAHTFENEMKGSVIFDIQECPLDLFFKNEFALIKERKCFGWPISYETENGLMEFLQTHEYKVFEISSSYGLCGWVFAKQVEVTVNEPSISATRKSKILLS